VTRLKRVCVYCGSKPGVRPEYAEAARALGRALAARGIGLVYGGGCVGLMGEVADAALAAGGEVTGVITDKLMGLEVGHQGLTELFVVESMHARKTMMAHLASAFVVLPGAWGTMEEMFEVLTWTQLGYHSKPIGLLDVAGYYRPLLDFADRAVSEGFLAPSDRALLVARDSLEGLLAALEAVEVRPGPRWIDQP
jgi:uncharacterized protein (TIGR00730 family)